MAGRISKIMRKALSALTAAALVSAVPIIKAHSTDDEISLDGWLLWHSYTDYSAMDSTLYLRDPNGETTVISGDFKHAMNGSFGNFPDDIVFMAIDEKHDEWDIYRFDSGNITNLTENSGARNEDPKFSPDGKKIVFKRGTWDHQKNDFSYELALLDLENGEVSILTDDPCEEAMPCFSGDGEYIYFARYENGYSSICRLKLSDRTIDTIYDEEGICAYYPIADGDGLYFTKWLSADDHTDSIVRYDGKELTQMPFNSAEYNCSDACPAGGEKLIYSCTRNGSYDLCFYDGADSQILGFASTEKHELGAAFFPKRAVKGDVDMSGKFDENDVALMRKWIIGEEELPDMKAGDMDSDGIIDVFDLAFMQRVLAVS